MKHFKSDVVIFFGFLMLFSFGLTMLNRDKKNPLIQQKFLNHQYHMVVPDNEAILNLKKVTNNIISMQELLEQTDELIQSRSVDVLAEYLQYIRLQISLFQKKEDALKIIVSIIDTFVKDEKSTLTVEDKIQLIIAMADKKYYSSYFDLLSKYDFLLHYKEPAPVIAFKHDMLGTIPLLMKWAATKKKIQHTPYSAFMYALNYNDKFPTMFENLYKAGLRVKDSILKSFIYELVFRNNDGNAFEFLKKIGADVNYVDKLSGMTPLILAVKTNKIKLVKKLLKAGANLLQNKEKNKTKSALDFARENKNIEIEALLLNHQAMNN